jgi:hypothetical protein
MSAITETAIAKLETKGFNRWTRGSHDRLYINPQSYGCEFAYYNTGNIKHATFRGEDISNAEGRRFKASKVYIDVKTGELHIQTTTDYEDEIRKAVEAIIAEVEAEEQAEDDPRTAPMRQQLLDDLKEYDAKITATIDSVDISDTERSKRHEVCAAVIARTEAKIKAMGYGALYRRSSVGGFGEGFEDIVNDTYRQIMRERLDGQQ